MLVHIKNVIATNYNFEHMSVQCSIKGVVIDFPETTEYDKTAKLVPVSVHQKGEREFIRVMVPEGRKYEKYKEYTFEGKFEANLFKGRLYKKFIAV